MAKSHLEFVYYQNDDSLKAGANLENQIKVFTILKHKRKGKLLKT